MTDVQTTSEEATVSTLPPEGAEAGDDRSPVAFYERMRSHPDMWAILTALVAHKRDEDDHDHHMSRPE